MIWMGGTEVGLKVSEEKTKYMRMYREKMNDDTHLSMDIRSFQRVEEFKYLYYYYYYSE